MQASFVNTDGKNIDRNFKNFGAFLASAPRSVLISGIFTLLLQ